MEKVQLGLLRRELDEGEGGGQQGSAAGRCAITPRSTPSLLLVQEVLNVGRTGRVGKPVADYRDTIHSAIRATTTLSIPLKPW